MWPATSAGFPPSVSINVSLRQIAATGFVTRVAELIAASGVDPTRVCLEVTETMLAGDVEPIVVVLRALRDTGVRLSIDDFGTGHASLTYLARFPVDQVKVDRSFVAGLGIDAGSAAIVGGVVAMSHTFDLRVIAEGVETGQQLQLLRAMHCDAVQGFLLSVPVSQEELLRTLVRQNSQLRIPGPRKAAEVSSEAGTDPGGPAAETGQRYRLLVEGAKEVTSCYDVQSVLDQALSALARTVRFTGGAILLVEDDVVRIGAACPTPTPQALASSVPLGQGVSGTIALTGEPRYLPDITIAASVTESRRKLASGGVRSWYGVPLISQGHPIGVLQIDSTEVDAFDEDDRLAVLSFAPVVTMALVSARSAASGLRAVPSSGR